SRWCRSCDAPRRFPVLSGFRRVWVSCPHRSCEPIPRSMSLDTQLFPKWCYTLVRRDLGCEHRSLQAAPGGHAMRAESLGEVLIVDDTPANLQLLTNLLKERGYKGRPVTSGALALRAAAARPPDLILLDINMP